MNITKQQMEQISNKFDEDQVKFSFLARESHSYNCLIQTVKHKYVLRIENNLSSRI